jgi:hypothetical protein
VLLQHDEATVNARDALQEVESGGPKQGVRKGKLATSRARQFFDPSFPPVPGSLGYIARAHEVDPTLWKSAVELNLECAVFSGGSDPDDVHQATPAIRLYDTRTFVLSTNVYHSSSSFFLKNKNGELNVSSKRLARLIR